MGTEGITPINHPLSFPLRESLGSFSNPSFPKEHQHGSDWLASPEAFFSAEANGAVAALFELLTEQLCMPRVSVVLGGAQALHREARGTGLSPEGFVKRLVVSELGAKLATYRLVQKGNQRGSAIYC